jgi:tetratricopeptide (TPR) repeat protein
MRTRWMTGGLLAALLAASPSSDGEGSWVELRGSALTVVSDADIADSRRILTRLEKVASAIASTAPSVPWSGRRELLVVAARNEESMRRLAPGQWGSEGGVRPSSLHLASRDQAFVLVRSELRADDDESHKAAYWGVALHLLGLDAPGLPSWVSRGLASFYARITVREQAVVLGRTEVSHIRTLRTEGLRPVTELYDGPSTESLDSDERRSLDAQSWALVHYLMLGDDGAHRPRFARFLALLREGGEAGLAAREALGDPGALDQALAGYVQRATFPTRTVEARGVSGFPAIRRLSAAEVLTLRAALYLADERPSEAQTIVTEALRLEPELAWAHETHAALAWAEGNHLVAREAAERALQIEPGRPVALRLRERASGPPTLKAAEHLCEEGDLEMCTRLGGWLIDGEGSEPDPARGVTLLDEACRAGCAEACRLLSWRLREGEGVVEDPVGAVTFLERACLAGDGEACLAAAGDHRAGRGVPVDVPAAVRMFELACTRGETAGCTALAWALQTGEGAERDLERAAALYLDACQAGDGSSCTRLGLLHLVPDGLPPDPTLARAMFTRGCGLGDAQACSQLEALNAAPTDASP